MYKLWIYHRNSRVSAFASPCAAIWCFLCIKAKQLNFHSSSPLAVLPMCVLPLFFLLQNWRERKKKEASELMVEYFSLGRFWEILYFSSLYCFRSMFCLCACSVSYLLLFFWFLIVSLCRFLQTQGAKLHRNSWAMFSASVLVDTGLSCSIEDFCEGWFD